MTIQYRLTHYFCAFFLLLSVYLTSYERPDHVPIEVWEQLKPYFLPEEHELKKRLDRVFKGRVVIHEDAVKQAKFHNYIPGRYSQIIVSSHRWVRGALLKFGTDNNPYVAWPQLKKRIEGAISLQATITALGYDKWFKVPKKWIYPLPPHLKPLPNAVAPENFILVVEDMNIVPRKLNYLWWKDSEKANPEMLKALFHVIETEGLSDSTVAFNLPFSRDERIAFIDLEHHHTWPIPYHRLLMYLNEEMQGVWREITDNRW